MEVIKGNAEPSTLSDAELRRWLKIKKTQRNHIIKKTDGPILSEDLLFRGFKNVLRLVAFPGQLQVRTYSNKTPHGIHFATTLLALDSRYQIDRLIRFLQDCRKFYPDTSPADHHEPKGKLLPLQTETPQTSASVVPSATGEPGESDETGLRDLHRPARPTTLAKIPRPHRKG